MMPEWIDHVRRLQFDHTAGPMIHDEGYGWRLTFHTTESSDNTTIDQAYSGYIAKGFSPHFTAEIRKGKMFELAQHIPLSMGATTMDNDPGGISTNRGRNIQIELLGRANDAADLFTSSGFWWLGEQLAPLFADGLIARQVTPRPFVDATDGFVAREGAPQRMTFDEWRAFSGICGHCHGPEDDHYDPGKIGEFLPAFLAGVTYRLEEDMPLSTEDLAKIRDIVNAVVSERIGFVGTNDAGEPRKKTFVNAAVRAIETTVDSDLIK